MPREGDKWWSCDAVREVLSADLDGEATPDERAGADTHVAGCPGCRRWFDDAAAVTRLARTSAAMAGPDVTEAVLTAAPGRWRARVVGGLRVALATIGIAQLALVATQIGGGTFGDGHTHDGVNTGHLGHETAAWGLAIAVGFLWVAARRGRPVAVLPILTAFIGYVVLLNASDLAGGRVDLQHAVTHLTEVVGYVIVLALCWPSLHVQTHPPARAPARSGGTVESVEPVDPPALPTLRPRPSGGTQVARVYGRQAA